MAKIKRSESAGVLRSDVSKSPSTGETIRTIPLRLEVMLQLLNHIEENCASSGPPPPAPLIQRIGLYTEGIFRISGDRITTNKIWMSFQSGQPWLQGNKHEIAGALKMCVPLCVCVCVCVAYNRALTPHRYLQNAPESLIPPSVFERILLQGEGTQPLTLSFLSVDLLTH